MIEEFSMEQLPEVAKVYTVTRHTIWQIADPYHILLYIQEGQCTVEIDGKIHLLNPGDLFLIPENSLYTRRPADDNMCTMVYIHFHLPCRELHTDRARAVIADLRDTMDQALFRDDSPAAYSRILYVAQHLSLKSQQEEIESLLQQAALGYNGNRLIGSMQMSLSLSRLLLLCSETTLTQLFRPDQLASDGKPPEKLQNAVLYIRQHYAEKISLMDLCKACAISRQQMIRYFHTFLDTTPNNYIAQYRMNKARQLLMNAPQMSMKEISAELGFDDPCYFSRVFTRTTGESPTEYRNRVTAIGLRKEISEE